VVLAEPAQEAVMAETKLVVEHREQLWSLLIEAAQIEHMIMCQYLYACFSLKTEPDEGLTAEQVGAVARWQETITGIAIEEMLHLALVMNVMTAIGAAPSLSRPNFPRHSEFLPSGVEFALLPFGADSVTHFLYLERPEGMERVDAAEFVPVVPPPEPVVGAEVMPRPQGFLTVGHLYRGIEQGLSDLAGRLGERVVFVGEPRAQATPNRFRWPQLIAVTDLASARAAIDEIIEQGEGARGDWRSAHYGRFWASGTNTRSCGSRTRLSSPPGRSFPPSPGSPSTSTSLRRSRPNRSPARSPSCSTSDTRCCFRC
jgi:hypothetical protein